MSVRVEGVFAAFICNSCLGAETLNGYNFCLKYDFDMKILVKSGELVSFL